MDEQPRRIVREIPPTFVRTREGGYRVVDDRMTVCAYARVSTASPEQEDSYERQVEHYTKYIAAHSDWKYGGVYADEGITGTRTDKRESFLKMMEAARRGTIQKILVKSISRFARNTVDALNNIRELKELGVGVYFETQNIDTMTPGGEVLITILAAMAEQESRSISTNIKWAYEKKFKAGEVTFNYKQFLGYDRDENKAIVIVPEEAAIVNRIYREYLSGHTMKMIAEGLMQDGIKSPTGKDYWYASTVHSILTNEKYMGDALLGKTYKPDVLSKKRLKNEGQSYQCYVENSHPAIIDKPTFQLVQAELERRSGFRSATHCNKGKYSSKYALSKKLICGECGMPFRRHAHTYKGVTTPTWVCTTHKLHGKEVCPQKYVYESAVKDAFVVAIAELIGDMSAIKNVLKTNIASSLDDTIALKLDSVQQRIDEQQARMIDANRKRRAGQIEDEEYNAIGAEIAQTLESLNREKKQYQSQVDASRLAVKRIQDITEVLESASFTTEFDDDLFMRLIEDIIVRGTTLQFNFKVGITKYVNLPNGQKKTE